MNFGQQFEAVNTTKRYQKKMLCVERILNTLFVIKVCQSLTIYQTHKEVTKISNVMPFSQYSPRFQQPGYSNIQQAQYQLNNHRTTTSPKMNFKTNEQPAAADAFESDELHYSNKHSQREPLLTGINYHNKIYHLKSMERASPLTNNKHWKKQRFNVRKQRNLRENHDNKLIERNIENMANVNEDSDQQSTKADSSHQPSTNTVRPTTETSHEIRYLHDIFLNYPKPHHANFGHTELSPVLFEKRFESQKAGNRYRGEIMWLDNTGGFAQHYWDLAQGRL